MTRPSKLNADREVLVEFAERWNAGISYSATGKVSIREISLQLVGANPNAPERDLKQPYRRQEQGEPAIYWEKCFSRMRHHSLGPPNNATMESEAKRLASRFRDLIQSGDALAISVYRIRNRERLLLLGNTKDRSKEWIEAEATRLAAVLSKREESEVERLALCGWARLEEWFPARYPKPDTL